jgi:hypothetical protein
MSLHTMYVAIPCRDHARFLEWLEANEERNHADDNDRNAATVMEAVSGRDDTICYMPVIPVIMLGALAPKPGATPFEMTHALKAMVAATAMLAAANGARELVFWGTNEATAKVAQYVGFEKVEMPLWRLRLP